MPETIETEIPVETEEHVENPAAVLKKNRELLSDIGKLKDRNAALEDLARDLGLDADALADPRAHIAKRADESRAAKERERTIREAVLLKLATEGRTPKDGLDALMAKVMADPNVKVQDGKVTGIDAVAGMAPRKAAPMPPSNPQRGWDEASGTYMTYDRTTNTHVRPTGGPAPATFEQLVDRGPEALATFARQSPAEYEKLRAAWQTRLANPGSRK